VDLGDFGGVRQVAEELASRYDSIDVVVNNAGARNDQFRTTASGLELTFAANHLGHFLLTCLLLDRLSAAPHGRVVTVASSSHFGAVTADGWLLEDSNYDRRQAYARSKLANVMFAYELARRVRGTTVTSLAVDPGNVASGFAGNNGPVARAKHLLSHLLRRNLIMPTTAAAALARVVECPEFAASSGSYLEGDRPAISLPLSNDAIAASRLWSLSVQLTGLNESNCRAWSRVRPA
jgi:NAD(P)-dependent dehydrogenase (short-subunit alcohol dehydrogenase family)